MPSAIILIAFLFPTGKGKIITKKKMGFFVLNFELKIMHSIDFCTVLCMVVYLSVLIGNSKSSFFFPCLEQSSEPKVQ